jgi:hypothetical protein
MKTGMAMCLIFLAFSAVCSACIAFDVPFHMGKAAKVLPGCNNNKTVVDRLASMRCQGKASNSAIAAGVIAMLMIIVYVARCR